MCPFYQRYFLFLRGKQSLMCSGKQDGETHITLMVAHQDFGNTQPSMTQRHRVQRTKFIFDEGLQSHMESKQWLNGCDYGWTLSDCLTAMCDSRGSFCILCLHHCYGWHYINYIAIKCWSRSILWVLVFYLCCQLHCRIFFSNQLHNLCGSSWALPPAARFTHHHCWYMVSKPYTEFKTLIARIGTTGTWQPKLPSVSKYLSPIPTSKGGFVAGPVESWQVQPQSQALLRGLGSQGCQPGWRWWQGRVGKDWNGGVFTDLLIWLWVIINHHWFGDNNQQWYLENND